MKLQGGAGNPNGVGAAVRLIANGKMGPLREVHAGSGYWSQDSAVQILGRPDAPTGIEVRWPGGLLSAHSLPVGARDITVPIRGSVEIRQ